MSETPIQPDLAVPQMAALANVSEDKVRQWCRNGQIEGAWDAGDGKRERWRVPHASWIRFRQRRAASERVQQTVEVRAVQRRRSAGGRNLLGV